MQRRRSVHAAGLGLIGALVLSGCASDPQPAGEAWKQARTQLDEASSLRLTNASTTGQQGPAVVAWDIAGNLASGDGTTVGTMGVGEDSRLKVETRRAGGTSYGRTSTEGSHVPDQLAAQYGEGQWRLLPAEQAQDNALRAELDRLALPSADALSGVDVEPQEVDLAEGHGLRYPVPADVARAAVQDGKAARLRSFTVDEKGTLIGLQVETDTAVHQYELSDWNSIEPAEAPEEVAQ